MTSSMTRLLLAVLTFCAFLSAQSFAAGAIQSTDENAEVVSEFDNLFSVRFLANYNYASLMSSEYGYGTLHSNRPLDIGFGIGLWDFSLDFKYTLPFTAGKAKKKSAGFDTGLDFFPRNLWMQVKYRKYSGLTSQIEYSSEDKSGSDDVATPEKGKNIEEQYVDLRQRDIYLSVIWVPAGKKKFSVRAPYYLDRIQSSSAGSPLFGGKIQYSSTEDMSGTLDFYLETRDIYSSWAMAGYSYTWVFEHNLFVNAWGLGGFAMGAIGSGALAFLPEFNGKLAFGRWHEFWSWNAVVQATYSPMFYSSHIERRLTASFEILVVKRF